MKQIEEDFEFLLKLEDSDDKNEDDTANNEINGQTERKVRVEIATEELNKLKEEARMRNFPLIEEYDFRKDTKIPDMKIELKPNTIVRDY